FDPTGLITILERVNEAIGDPHYHIRHSFFLHEQLGTACADIWQMEIEPYLEEYFFNQPDQVDRFRWASIREQIIPHAAN
ncbi:MAG: ATPase, partial [Chloroflexi bacterium]|nr:ATPase [Chloroflexota bacterium]